MARKSTPATPQRAVLSQSEMRKAVARFEKIIGLLEEFNPSDISGSDDPRITELATAISTGVEKTYNADSQQHKRYINAAHLRRYSLSIMYDTPLSEIREGVGRGVTQAVALLGSAIDDLQEDIEDQTVALPRGEQETESVGRSVFVVHGHDSAARESIARFLQQIELEPIILHEQAAEGQTIIEKFERHADVGFAVVLLTPDDVGGPDEENLRSRARQNVVLELGYFIGRLGRDRVCALRKGDTEIPSDYAGVEYIPLDDAGAWRQELAQEIQAAGIEVDFNKVFKR